MSIYLPDLISTLADACSRGCEVIQQVQRKREEGGAGGGTGGHGNDQGNANGSNDNSIAVQYKVADDPRSALTEADVASQKVIVHCIRDAWGDDLKIIGEEDDDGDDNGDTNAKTSSTSSDGDEKLKQDGDVDIAAVFEKYDVDLPTKRAIQKDLFKGESDEKHPHLVEPKELCLYIDPMDGTREFVEKRLHNVQCLIGITYMGHPVGGVIGLPFLSFNGVGADSGSNTEDGINVVCALYSFDAKNNILDMMRFENRKGNATLDGKNQSWLSLEKQENNNGNNDEREESPSSSSGRKKDTVVKVFTGDSNRLPKKKALEYINKLAAASNSGSDKDNASGDISIELCIAGGCGNKILRTIAYAASNPDMNAIAVIPPGTSLWDTAAPTAMLRAAQVKFGITSNVTDMFGGQLVYDSTGSKVTNDLGVFVSFGDVAAKYHIELCKNMRSDAIILDSLLRKYWTVPTAGDVGDVGEEVRIRLKNSQMKPQSVDTTRNAKGYVLTCEEIEALVADQTSFGSCKLIGYAMPERMGSSSSSGDAASGTPVEVDAIDESVQELQLFWNQCQGDDDKSGSRESPPGVVQLMVNGSQVRIALCE